MDKSTLTIPAEIRRDQVINACEILGFDPTQVRHVEISGSGEIVVELFEIDDEGRRYLNEDESGLKTRTVRRFAIG